MPISDTHIVQLSTRRRPVCTSQLATFTTNIILTIMINDELNRRGLLWHVYGQLSVTDTTSCVYRYIGCAQAPLLRYFCGFVVQRVARQIHGKWSMSFQAPIDNDQVVNKRARSRCALKKIPFLSFALWTFVLIRLRVMLFLFVGYFVNFMLSLVTFYLWWTKIRLQQLSVTRLLAKDKEFGIIARVLRYEMPPREREIKFQTVGPCRMADDCKTSHVYARYGVVRHQLMTATALQNALATTCSCHAIINALLQL